MLTFKLFQSTYQMIIHDIINGLLKENIFFFLGNTQKICCVAFFVALFSFSHICCIALFNNSSNNNNNKKNTRHITMGNIYI